MCLVSCVLMPCEMCVVSCVLCLVECVLGLVFLCLVSVLGRWKGFVCLFVIVYVYCVGELLRDSARGITIVYVYHVWEVVEGQWSCLGVFQSCCLVSC